MTTDAAAKSVITHRTTGPAPRNICQGENVRDITVPVGGDTLRPPVSGLDHIRSSLDADAERAQPLTQNATWIAEIRKEFYER
ncbi:hypothetical protein Gbth_041_078 [Gluconobacter thailandicus F149-1 = NBRC 100600]|nr:hypothetical protein Gbfr_029_080 [Gluconobacter frateurii M-2]GAN93982.1 hypothetical protein Gbth_041_078 [Gluconobacter thailandicus F149-1 = NBRC 100600]